MFSGGPLGQVELGEQGDSTKRGSDVVLKWILKSYEGKWPKRAGCLDSNTDASIREEARQTRVRSCTTSRNPPTWIRDICGLHL
jgi:hypothetical protein